jgi:hypothetical protein
MLHFAPMPAQTPKVLVYAWAEEGEDESLQL